MWITYLGPPNIATILEIRSRDTQLKRKSLSKRRSVSALNTKGGLPRRRGFEPSISTSLVSGCFESWLFGSFGAIFKRFSREWSTTAWFGGGAQNSRSEDPHCLPVCSSTMRCWADQLSRQATVTVPSAAGFRIEEGWRFNVLH